MRAIIILTAAAAIVGCGAANDDELSPTNLAGGTATGGQGAAAGAPADPPPEGGSGPSPCVAGTEDCGGTCVDTDSSVDHCGGCYQACGAGQQCVSSQCVASADDPCEGMTCNDHGFCAFGACLCDPGYEGPSCGSCSGSWVLATGRCEPPNLLDGTAAGEQLDGTAADEIVRGHDGDDHVRGFDGMDLVNGNVGKDFVNGNVGRDEVHGGAGDDEVHGGAGDDVVFGGGGNDTVYGGDGVDRLVGGEGHDTILGGPGNDHYVIDGLGHDTFDDEDGVDQARCQPGVTIITDQMDQGDRVLSLSTGGTVVIAGNRVEVVVGCD